MSPLRVVVTGAESTGKTTLAGSLAELLRVPFVPEAAREWVERHGRAPSYADVEAIAKHHAENEAVILRPDHSVHLLDTDLISTVVYSHYYFGKCPARVVTKARSNRADLYLLQTPDFDWQPDPGQRDGPHIRSAVQAFLANELRLLGANVQALSGESAYRTASALRLIRGAVGAPHG